MRRTTLNFVVDLIGFVDLLLLATTGGILRWVLPPGSGGGHGDGFRRGRDPGEIKELLGLGRHDWGDIHFVLALLFVLVMLIHLYLHWRWIVTYVALVFSSSRNGTCAHEDESQVP
jgi:hypothetical protein